MLIVNPRVPEEVRNYAEMAYAAAQGKIEQAHDVKVAALREQMGAKDISYSNADSEAARVYAERVRALLLARADSLIEGYELHDKLDDHAAKAILADVFSLHDAMMESTRRTLIADAKTMAWRSRSSSAAAVANAEELSRQVFARSRSILSEIGCEIERRRVTPRMTPAAKAAFAKRSAVRPTGPYSYHPEIERVSQTLCDQGNFRQAVLDAFIHVIHRVRALTLLPYDGDDLMNRAFSADNRVPPVRFNSLQTVADKDEQRGILYLFKGVVGLRNFNAHVVTTLDNPHRAHEYLALASVLMRLLDTAEVDAAPKP